MKALNWKDLQTLELLDPLYLRALRLAARHSKSRKEMLDLIKEDVERVRKRHQHFKRKKVEMAEPFSAFKKKADCLTAIIKELSDETISDLIRDQK